jgi:hypothetical protein
VTQSVAVAQSTVCCHPYRSDISCFTASPVRSPHCTPLYTPAKLLHQFTFTVPHISDRPVPAFHILHCHLSVITSNIFFIQSQLCTVCQKYFILLIVNKVFIECLGIFWLVIDAFILLTVRGIFGHSFICFPLLPHSTAGNTVVCSSLTFVLAETTQIFFVKFAIATLF